MFFIILKNWKQSNVVPDRQAEWNMVPVDSRQADWTMVPAYHGTLIPCIPSQECTGMKSTPKLYWLVKKM
jgi:hypothetical protein